MDQPFASAGARLEQALAERRSRRCTSRRPPTDLETARRWFEMFEGAGLDGLIAKPADIAVRARQAADVQDQARAHGRRGGGRLPVAQVRPGVGSLLLGLYDERGHAAPRRRHRRRSPMARRAELLEELAPVPARTPGRDAPVATAAVDGPDRRAGQRRARAGSSRWTGGKDLGWEPLRPELVVEVGYDAMEGDRFRHTAQFQRWRPDREPALVHATSSWSGRCGSTSTRCWPATARKS